MLGTGRTQATRSTLPSGLCSLLALTVEECQQASPNLAASPSLSRAANRRGSQSPRTATSPLALQLVRPPDKWPGWAASRIKKGKRERRWARSPQGCVPKGHQASTRTTAPLPQGGGLTHEHPDDQRRDGLLSRGGQRGLCITPYRSVDRGSRVPGRHPRRFHGPRRRERRARPPGDPPARRGPPGPRERALRATQGPR